MIVLALILCLGLTLARHRPGPGTGAGLLVSTSSGRIQGKIDAALPDTRQFLGIPYAQPPVGELRWAPPQELVQPNRRVDATTLPPSCQQFLSSSENSIYTNDVLQFNLQGLNRTGNVSEDCLTLSVWTPTPEKCCASETANSNGHVPVLIFVYGGGDENGGEDVPYQIPAQWVERTKDHVVVSFNYRLNIFGFPNVKGLGNQNFGVQDVRLAVQWCQRNIAAFGGDPDRMVLWGQSAGAASTDLYNYAYYKDPIVTGFIMDSGTAALEIGNDPGGSNFTFVADHVGCGGLGAGSEQQLACMRKVPADKIEGFLAAYADSQSSPSLSFIPAIDGITVFSNYTQRTLQGKLTNLPAIYGSNAQDGVAFAPYNPDGPNATIAQTQLLTDFVCPATAAIRNRQRVGRVSYRFMYAGNFSNISPRPWMGAYHSSELPLLMGTHPDFRGPSTQLEYATSEAMQDAWVAFAADAEGGLAGQHWTAYQTLGSKQVRQFGGRVAAEDVSIAQIEDMCASFGA